MVIQAREGLPQAPASLKFTVNSSGGISSVVVVDGGRGYSGMVDVGVITRGDQSANIASSISKTRGANSANIASVKSVTEGVESLNAASANCTVSGERSVTLGSSGSTADGVGSIVISGNESAAAHDGCVVFGRRVATAEARSIVFGDASDGSASSSNRKFEVGANGVLKASGNIVGSANFTDYAEYFENKSSGVLPLGTIVSLDGRKVRPSRQGDTILGVISATAVVIAGDSPFQWAGRYLLGEFDEPLYEDVAMIKWKALEGRKGFEGRKALAFEEKLDIPADAISYVERLPVLNPEYDDSMPNKPRSERPLEWSCVGLLGQVRVRVDASVKQGGFVSADEGLGRISEAPTNLVCMEIRHEFDSRKGYAVALCFLR